MASVSAETMILFIASMLIAASIAGTFSNSVGQLGEALQDQGVQMSEEVRTDVEIISDSGSDAIFDSNGNKNLTLLVKNTGTENLNAEPGQIDVLVDGKYQSADEMTVKLQGDADTWGQGEVVELNMTNTDLSVNSGDHRAKVIVNGDEEVFEFRL